MRRFETIIGCIGYSALFFLITFYICNIGSYVVDGYRSRPSTPQIQKPNTLYINVINDGVSTHVDTFYDTNHKNGTPQPKAIFHNSVLTLGPEEAIRLSDDLRKAVSNNSQIRRKIDKNPPKPQPLYPLHVE